MQSSLADRHSPLRTSGRYGDRGSNVAAGRLDQDRHAPADPLQRTGPNSLAPLAVMAWRPTGMMSAALYGGLDGRARWERNLGCDALRGWGRRQMPAQAVPNRTDQHARRNPSARRSGAGSREPCPGSSRADGSAWRPTSRTAAAGVSEKAKRTKGTPMWLPRRDPVDLVGRA